MGCVSSVIQDIAAPANPPGTEDGDAGTASYKRAQKEFKKADTDGDGNLDTTEFRKAFRLPDTVYMARLMQIIDTDGDGSVSFEEFCVGMMRFERCSELSDNIKFAFLLFDEDDSGEIGREEILKALRMSVNDAHEVSAWKDNKGEIKGKIRKVMTYLEKECGPTIDFKEFTGVCHKYPLIFAPAYEISTRLHAYAKACGKVARRQGFQAKLKKEKASGGAAVRKSAAPAASSRRPPADRARRQSAENETFAASDFADGSEHDATVSPRDTIAAHSPLSSKPARMSDYLFDNNDERTAHEKRRTSRDEGQRYGMVPPMNGGHVNGGYQMNGGMNGAQYMNGGMNGAQYMNGGMNNGWSQPSKPRKLSSAGMPPSLNPGYGGEDPYNELGAYNGGAMRPLPPPHATWGGGGLDSPGRAMMSSGGHHNARGGTGDQELDQIANSLFGMGQMTKTFKRKMKQVKDSVNTMGSNLRQASQRMVRGHRRSSASNEGRSTGGRREEHGRERLKESSFDKARQGIASGIQRLKQASIRIGRAGKKLKQASIRAGKRLKITSVRRQKRISTLNPV